MKNPFYEGLTTPDEKNQPKAVIEIPNLEQLLKKFSATLNKNRKTQFSHFNIFDIVEIPNILTPEQINTFLQYTMTYEDRPNYKAVTSHVISQLIQNSYRKGYNNFRINTKTLQQFDFFAGDLTGKKRKPIHINIEGDIGKSLGFQSRYIAIEVNGDVGHTCAEFADNSSFKLNGKIGMHYGLGSENCTFDPPPIIDYY